MPLTATLIENPVARDVGRFREQRPAITALLQAQGYTAEYRQTLPDSAATFAVCRQALRHSSLILACGGDGTVHAVLQAMMGSNEAKTPATLGLVPLGTANALARNLRLLPGDPLAAVAKLLSWTPRRLPVGEFVAGERRRFFFSMAGCGPDGALAHVLAAASVTKARFGRSAYYGHAARLFLTRRWPAFSVEYRLPGEAAWHSTSAVALLASRVPDLGGLFTRLTPQAALDHPHLHLQLLRPPAELSLPAWFACAHTSLRNPWLTSVDAAEVRCSAFAGTRPVYAQADAEPIGTLPFALRMIPDAVSLLMPPPAVVPPHR